jgi:diguanylate cyclase (GGDEF)-like protein
VPARDGHDSIDARVERDLLSRARRMIGSSIPIGFPTMFAATAAIDTTSPAAERGWLAATAAAYVVAGLVMLGARGRQIHLALATGIMGVTWGSAGLVLSPSDPPEQALLLMFVVGVAAFGVCTCVSGKWVYPAVAIPLWIGTAAWQFTGLDPSLRINALMGMLFFPSLIVAHRLAHKTLRSAMLLGYEREGLAVEVELERTRLAAANAALVGANDALLDRATHDQLTGLPNRAKVLDRLQQITSAAGDQESLVGLLFIDLDRFKFVNDSLGHGAGDELLKVIAKRLANVLPATAMLARLGGDEFVVLLDQIERPADAEAVAQRLRRTLDDPVVLGDRTLTVSLSIGVSTSVVGDDAPEDLLRHADAALYVAKDNGRNQVATFDANRRASLARRVDEIEELRTAVANREVEAWFQPEIDLFTGDIVGAEALARWCHPTRGVLAAGAFMPLAEESGLGEQISSYVAAQAMRFRAGLERAGAAHDFLVRLNVSPRQLTVVELERFLDTFERLGCPFHGIAIEVTETAIIHDLDHANKLLQWVRDYDIGVALDDFGTGHSSLALLQRLPIDAVKIDRSFVRDIVDDPRDRAVVRAVLGLAAELGLSVTAEGVETEEQAELLRSMGCRRAQGFLYSPAIAPDDLLDRLGLGPATARLAA